MITDFTFRMMILVHTILGLGANGVERMLKSDDKPLIIFQQLVKEGRQPVFMLRYAGKSSRPDATILRTPSNKDEDPKTPKSAIPPGEPLPYQRY
jgi:hypothetical protein